MKIYTRTGDAGTTGLFSGQRVAKTHPRVSAYGTVDEMNSVLGVARSAKPVPQVEAELVLLQARLFDLGADLATAPGGRAVPRILPAHVAALEAGIDRMLAEIPPMKAFVLPGGSPAAAQIHLARAICRRAEREAVAAAASEDISPEALVYLNRLSDFLFALARYENHLAGVAEQEWRPER